MDTIRMLILNPATAWVIIPVVAIVMAGIRSILRQKHRHRERMAMIEQGLDPDAPQRTS